MRHTSINQIIIFQTLQTQRKRASSNIFSNNAASLTCAPIKTHRSLIFYLNVNSTLEDFLDSNVVLWYKCRYEMENVSKEPFTEVNGDAIDVFRAIC